jgi:hypothetical protein
VKPSAGDMGKGESPRPGRPRGARKWDKGLRLPPILSRRQPEPELDERAAEKTVRPHGNVTVLDGYRREVA